jgi:HSP20 family protein
VNGVARGYAEAMKLEAQPVPVNVYEADDAIVIVAPLPGVMPDDVEVVVDGDRVVIEAAMRTLAPKDYLLHEWHYGPYRREVQIPEEFGGDPVASFGNGQLAVRVPRGEMRPGPRVAHPT